LHQYLTYQTEDENGSKKKKRVINLDDDEKKKKWQDAYKPPENLVIRLSKIPMPELVPKARPHNLDPSTSDPAQHLTKPNTGGSFFGLFRKDNHTKSSSSQISPPPLPTRPASAGVTLDSKPSKFSRPFKSNNSSPTNSRTSSSTYDPAEVKYSPPSMPPLNQPVHDYPPPKMPMGQPQSQPNWQPPPGPPPNGTPLQDQGSFAPSLTSLLGTAALHMFSNRQ
jgi:hypothetical protein